MRANCKRESKHEQANHAAAILFHQFHDAPQCSKPELSSELIASRFHCWGSGVFGYTYR